MIMKSCRTCGTKIHLNILPSSIQSLYSNPSSLINIFCSSVSLCNFFATSLQYVSFFCSCCSWFGFNGSLISLRSSCIVISMQGFVHDSRECSRNLLPLHRVRFFRWLLFKLYLESLHCQFHLQILRMFLKFTVDVLCFLFICTIPFYTWFLQLFFVIFANHLNICCCQLAQ